MGEYYPKKKKICQLCAGRVIDYKNPVDMNKLVNEKGKILPRRVTGACAKHQREVATAVKRARLMAILPFEK